VQYVVACCSVLQCVAVCCSVLYRVAVCCSVLQCVAVCCSVLQCVAPCCSVSLRCSVRNFVICESCCPLTGLIPRCAMTYWKLICQRGLSWYSENTLEMPSSWIHGIFVTWLIHMCAMTYSYVREVHLAILKTLSRCHFRGFHESFHTYEWVMPHI